MKNYDNPKMFRDEADSLERFVLSHQFLKPYLDSYNIHMAKYFLAVNMSAGKRLFISKIKYNRASCAMCTKKRPAKI